MSISKVFLIFGRLISYVYTLKFSSKLKRIGDLLYTGWWSRKFGNLSGILERHVEILGASNIYIGNDAYIRNGTILCTCTEFNGSFYAPKLEIGNHVLIGRNCHLSACLNMSIGSNTVLSDRVTIVDNVHGEFTGKSLTYKNGSDIPDVMFQSMYERKLGIKGPVNIGENVYIGEGVVILSGVAIGKNSVIGNNCLITKDIPPYSIVTSAGTTHVVTFE